MESDIMKNIVILKNLPSNLVEQAFVVLKENEKIHIEDLMNNNRNNSNKEGISENNKDSDKQYIVKEAEMLIENYLSDIEKRKDEKGKNIWKLKYEKAKILNIFLLIMSAIIFIKSFI